VISTSASARVWNVKPDGTGDAPTIQAAIRSAEGRMDTVRVAAGVYYEYDISIIMGELTIVSTTGQADCVTIDGGQLGTVFDIGRSVNAPCIIKGFTITGGVRSGLIIYEDSSPNLINLSIENNFSPGDGGGIYLDQRASATLTNVTFVNNSATSEGSAMYLSSYSSAVLSGCHFYDHAGNRGAVHMCDLSSASFSATEFAWNASAVQADGRTTAEFYDCRFYENSIAIYTYGGSVTCSTCVFLSNGRGVTVDGWGPSQSTWTNSVFAQNRGPAMELWENASLVQNCTFVQNSSGITIANMEYAGGPVTIERSIIAYNAPGEAVVCIDADSTDIAMSCCDVFGNAQDYWATCIEAETWDETNFSACPSFCLWDIIAYDSRLSYELCDHSPCLPGRHPHRADCGLIGALGLGCSCGASQTVPTTWGAIKAMYK